MKQGQGTGMRALALALSLLALGGAGMAGAALAQAGKVVSANLFGDQVEGGKGHAEGSGDFNAYVETAKGEICYYLEAEGVGEATAAHIHEGTLGESGPAVVTLQMAEMDEACVTLDPALVARITGRADQFYVDIHTAAYPDGALRGQLAAH